MKRNARKIIVLSLALAGFVVGVNLFCSRDLPLIHPSTIVEDASGVKHRPKSDQPDQALLWYFTRRAYPGSEIPVDWKQRALDHIQTTRAKSLAVSPESMTWTSVGPTNIAGRVRGVAIDPTNPAIIYSGSVSGGVWKSTNGGSTWIPTSDFADNIAISSIAIDPTNPNIIYAGTGEGFFNYDAVRGAGVLKSIDGGSSWTMLTSFSGGSSFPYFINDLKIRPDNTNILFAASNSGLFRTTNAGASWSMIKEGQSTPRTTQIVLDPNDPSTMYVAFGNFRRDGIYKSTDGGGTFSKLSGGGFPVAGYHRIALAIAPSNSQVIYACLTDSATYQAYGIFKSVNGGGSWSRLTTPNDPELGGTHLGGQGWYNNVLAAHPSNPNIVFAGGVNLFRSTNGGGAWSRISDGYPPFSNPYVHVDHHAIHFDPSNSSIIYFGTDGGMFKTTDGGTSFLEINAGLVTAQFYSGAVHPTIDVYFGGTQDNGTLRLSSGTNWTMVFGGDGGATAVDFNNPSVVYTEYVNLSFQKSTNGGTTWLRAMSGIPVAGPGQGDGTSDRVQFIAPFTMDPSNPSRILAGTYKIYQTVNQAGSWSAMSGDLTGDGTGSIGSTITAIAIAKSSSATVFAGTSGSGSSAARVMVTTDNGGIWTNETRAPLPNRTVAAIAIDPNNSDRAIAGYSGFNTNTPSTLGHVFLTTNRGASWRDISSNLPDIPINAALIDSADQTYFVIGTDLGIFESADGGASWGQQPEGMGNVVVSDLDLRTDRMLFAATHGRGMFRRPLAIPTIAHTVYPGDANGDGVVDVRDVLPIGRFYGKVGAARLTPSLSWTPQYLRLTWWPREAADADCDGNGKVEASDVQAIIANWYRTRTLVSGPVGDPIAATEIILNSIGRHSSSEAMQAIRKEVLRYRSQLLGIGSDWKLDQNYPNPFNPTTTIRFTVPVDGSVVRLRIIDALGRTVTEVIMEDLLPGTYTWLWDGRSDSGIPVASGIYFYQLQSEGSQLIRKMVLAR